MDKFVKANPERKIKRHNFGTLLSSTWSKVIHSKNVISGFSTTQIWPLKPSAIPAHAYLNSSSTLSIISDSDAGCNDGKNYSSQQIAETCATSDVEISNTISALNVPTPTKLLNALFLISSTSGASKRKQFDSSYTANIKEKLKNKEDAQKKKKEKQKLKLNNQNREKQAIKGWELGNKKCKSVKRQIFDETS